MRVLITTHQLWSCSDGKVFDVANGASIER
jgi:hypothetical protein